MSTHPGTLDLTSEAPTEESAALATIQGSEPDDSLPAMPSYVDWEDRYNDVVAELSDSTRMRRAYFSVRRK